MFEVIQHRVGPRILKWQQLQNSTWNRQISQAAAKILLRLHFHYAFYGAWSPWRFCFVNFEQGKEAP